MNKMFFSSKIIFSIILIIISFYCNYYYANLGVYPIDTFAFFDTAYNVLIGRHPFKDIWVTTGPFVDYMQAFFFKVFGLNWKSYVIHGSLVNSLITLYFFKTLVDLNFSKILSFIYALCFSILCYTISGTPFAYIHSYVFSLLSILVFVNGVSSKSIKCFFFLPLTMSMAFLSMQNPSTFINFIILIFLTIFFFQKENLKYLYSFFKGGLFVLFLLILFFAITNIPLVNFLQQYILFPLFIGESRVLGDEMAHLTLTDRFTFRNVIGHFKFINILLIIFTYINLKDFIKNRINFSDKIINFSLIFFGVFFIFNQLITSNQTYIFSFIPFLAAFIHLYICKSKRTNKLKWLILIIMIFSTVKYHQVYNQKRKFMDLQHVNLSNSIDAELMDVKFKGLKWITPVFPNNPKLEIQFLKEAIADVKKENRKKIVFTTYQFFSFITEENLNIPNRWYTNDNNSYPLENHKYYNVYKKHLEKAFYRNKVQVAYTVGPIKFSNFKIYIKDICFDKTKINKLTTKYVLKSCE